MAVYIGYIASIFLAISLLVAGAFKFRIINMLGQIFFIAYGIMIIANPIVIANSVLLCINVYQLSKLLKQKEQFKFVEIGNNNNLIDNFVAFHAKDITTFFPDFNYKESIQQPIRFVVLRDEAIANIFIGSIDNTGIATVRINYTIPKYRDYKVGRYIFDSDKDYLQSKQINKVVYNNLKNIEHLEFIKIMGFTEEVINNKSCWSKSL